MQALAALQPTTTTCGVAPHLQTPPPNPHQVATVDRGHLGVRTPDDGNSGPTQSSRRGPATGPSRTVCTPQGGHTHGPQHAVLQRVGTSPRARTWPCEQKRSATTCFASLKTTPTTMRTPSTTCTSSLQLAEIEQLADEAARAHGHAWGHPTEAGKDLTKVAYLLQEGHQSHVIHQAGGTSLQPLGFPRAQPELPLQALQHLQELEPFVTGQERELVGQAMADLATWSTQFWGHAVTVVHNDADHEATQIDLQEEDRGPAPSTNPGTSVQPGHTRLSETMWRSMVESSEGDTHERETLLLPPAEPEHKEVHDHRKTS